jgi:hypothetical protein
MPSAGFEPVIPANEWLQTLASDGSATVIGTCSSKYLFICLGINCYLVDVLGRNLAGQLFHNFIGLPPLDSWDTVFEYRWGIDVWLLC